MATRNAVFTDVEGDGSVVQFDVTGLLLNDDSAPVRFAQWADRCVQIDGVLGAGGTVVVEGSNDGASWFTLNSAQGTALSFTAAGLKQVVEVPRFARARVTAGDGTTNINVRFVLRRANPMRT